MAGYVVDSDILTFVLQRKQNALDRFRDALRTNAEIYLCPIVYYEVHRGLLHKGATRQLREFDQLTSGLLWADYERPMWRNAAELYASSRRQGRPHDDADLLIAAFTRQLGATLVTNNTADFEHLDVPLVNWAE